jgi:phage tail-like protein
MSENSDRVESALPCYFGVEIEGIQTARFFRCEGLEAETYVYEVEEGGRNAGTLKFFGRTRFPNLVLDHGVCDNNELFEWYKTTVMDEEKVERKNGSVVMFNSNGDEIKRWNFFRALPCRWVGPQLGTEVRGIAFERIEIAHEGFQVEA